MGNRVPIPPSSLRIQMPPVKVPPDSGITFSGKTFDYIPRDASDPATFDAWLASDTRLTFGEWCAGAKPEAPGNWLEGRREHQRTLVRLFIFWFTVMYILGTVMR